MLPTLSVWQPWASLLAHGHKRIETRSWRWRGGGLPVVLALHAETRRADTLAASFRDVLRDLLACLAPHYDGFDFDAWARSWTADRRRHPAERAIQAARKLLEATPEAATVP